MSTTRSVTCTLNLAVPSQCISTLLILNKLGSSKVHLKMFQDYPDDDAPDDSPSFDDILNLALPVVECVTTLNLSIELNGPHNAMVFHYLSCFTNLTRVVLVNYSCRQCVVRSLYQLYKKMPIETEEEYEELDETCFFDMVYNIKNYNKGIFFLTSDEEYWPFNLLN